MGTETTQKTTDKVVPLDALTEDMLNSTEKRLELLIYNEYRLNEGFDISNEVLKPINNNLSKLKLYIIAEDTCFDFLGLHFNDDKELGFESDIFCDVRVPL